MWSKIVGSRVNRIWWYVTRSATYKFFFDVSLKAIIEQKGILPYKYLPFDRFELIKINDFKIF